MSTLLVEVYMTTAISDACSWEDLSKRIKSSTKKTCGTEEPLLDTFTPFQFPQTTAQLILYPTTSIDKKKSKVTVCRPSEVSTMGEKDSNFSHSKEEIAG